MLQLSHPTFRRPDDGGSSGSGAAPSGRHRPPPTICGPAPLTSNRGRPGHSSLYERADLFDPKPTLQPGSAAPRDILNQIEFADEVGGLLPSPFAFSCGMEVSELPALVVDEITLIRSMHGDLQPRAGSLPDDSGRTLPNRGSWVVYALGSEARDLRLRGAGRGAAEGLQNPAWLPSGNPFCRPRSTGLNPSIGSWLPAERALLRRLDRAHRHARPWPGTRRSHCQLRRLAQNRQRCPRSVPGK